MGRVLLYYCIILLRHSPLLFLSTRLSIHSSTSIRPSFLPSIHSSFFLSFFLYVSLSVSLSLGSKAVCVSIYIYTRIRKCIQNNAPNVPFLCHNCDVHLEHAVMELLWNVAKQLENKMLKVVVTIFTEESGTILSEIGKTKCL